jgi:hypothetical protein
VALEVDLLVAERGGATPAELDGLVLDHDVQPLVRRGGIERPGPAQEDLHAALVGVMRVVITEAVAIGGTQQGLRLGIDRAENQLLCFILSKPCPSILLGRREGFHVPVLGVRSCSGCLGCGARLLAPLER